VICIHDKFHSLRFKFLTSKMDSKTLASLPSELQSHILSYVSLATLFSFARTNKFNYQLSTSNLNRLHIAIFPKKIHSVLAFLNDDDDDFLIDRNLKYKLAIGLSADPTTKIGQPIPKPTIVSIPFNGRTTPSYSSPRYLRHGSIHAQNHQLNDLLSTPSLSHLKTLTIHTTALLAPSLTSTLSRFPYLQDLTLNFSHSHIHDPSMVLPTRYWTSTPSISDEGSPVWNGLAGVGETNERDCKVRGLKKLKVTRAAITAKQLQEWVKRNDELKEVRLAMVSGVERIFLEALTDRTSRKLRVLELEKCENLILNEEEHFEWVEKLVDAGLARLGLQGCKDVDGCLARRLYEERGWHGRGLETLRVPGDQTEVQSCDGKLETSSVCSADSPSRLEVDPRYL
jgi:hypothetical protein